MQKNFSASANKINSKSNKENKLIRSTMKINSTKKVQNFPTEKKQKKVSTEDRYYNSFNLRNGFQSVDNRKMKRKSNGYKTKFNIKEFSIDVEKLDRAVNEIWWKFVNYFNYDNIFKLDEINFTKEEKEKFLNSNKKKKEIDFELKLQTIFNIYKIRKTNDNYNLISDSEEGSYLLQHAKIWIIYIKNLIERNNLKFRETHQIFNFALEYDADEHLLFDYFITIAREFDEEDIMDVVAEFVPFKFVEMYNNNKEHVLKTLKEEDEKEKKEKKEEQDELGSLRNFVINPEDKSENQLLKQQEEVKELNLTNTNNKDTHTKNDEEKEIQPNKMNLIMSFTDDENNKSLNEENLFEKDEDNLNINKVNFNDKINQFDDNLDNEHDFSFNTNKITNEEVKSLKESVVEADKFEDNKELDESLLIVRDVESSDQINFKSPVNLELNQDILDDNPTQDQNDSFNHYLQANTNSSHEVNLELIKLIDNSHVNPILEESKESENESILNFQNVKDSIKKLNSLIPNKNSQIESTGKNEENTEVISINLITPLKSNMNDKEIILLSSFNKNRRNDYSLKKLIFGRDFTNEYDEAKLIDPNIRNSGNFAVLELLSKSQEKVGHKFVLTPLKKQICLNKKEYEEAEKDLAEIHKVYSDFIYQPYDEDLKEKIKKK